MVIKEISSELGTKIENKIHSKADKETLTPILTTIGLGLNDGIQNINQVNNVIVEGPSDYFYLQGLKTILKTSEFNFVFGGGAGNMGNVGAILSGWGCNVIYLYDNDKGKTDGSKNLLNNWYVNKELILSVKESAGSVEDLFSRSDFMKYVLNVKVLEKDLTNSAFQKTNQTRQSITRQTIYFS
ncbi:MAG: hypothetical protein IPN67_16670 [Bacteroidales bacterium]|nr:hypothetical protein [Bacteroidales bacterium]